MLGYDIVSRADGRCCCDRKDAGEESPGFKETRHRITSGRRNPRESAAETYRSLSGSKVEKAR